MNARPLSQHRLGITLRTALLSWLVSIATLLIFVTAIIPQQKRTFLQNLDSKAHGLAASLLGVAAGAAVNDDYPSMVDYCQEMLTRDQNVEYIVLAKKDDLTFLIHQKGWHYETNNVQIWRPEKLEPLSGIGVGPLTKRPVFQYSQRFVYSGIHWGWIHVGLSLESYDRSVQGVYRRTGLLAVFCLLFGLGASVVYAKRLVRPLHQLNQVVSHLTAGDLAARADIRSGDEIQDLAESFNTMTDALLQRDRILESVRIAAQQFLTSPNWQLVIDGVLANIGQAAAVSRVFVFENHTSPEGNLLCSQRYEWVSPGTPPQIDNPRLQGFPWRGAGYDATADRLQRGEIVANTLQQLNPAAPALPGSQGIQSLVLVPITVEGAWWGFLGLDECTCERKWTDAERDSLRAAADILGAAIARHRTQEALLEAKNTLEQRVRERTRELRDQMAAKERAHADLAEAQHRLVEISRQAGMAEVATGVLHNVGNVLNSVNVSCTLSIDRLQQSRLANLPKVTAMLEQQNGNLLEFLTQDPRGKQIPGYLSALAPVLVEEQSSVLQELHSLRDKIDHIKEIVAMQQSYAKVSGLTETISVSQLIENALQLNASALARHQIQVERQFDELPPATLDKHKVLQILLNLIRNAKHALDDGGGESKVMTLRLFSRKSDRLSIQVSDNGVGIPPENLTRIFAHGFTTRKDGHGFGLHSGALAAKELNGSLTAESAGPGQGATFTLELPFNSRLT